MDIEIYAGKDLHSHFATVNNIKDRIFFNVSYCGTNIFRFQNSDIQIIFNKDNNTIVGINILQPINLYHNSLELFLRSMMGFFASNDFRNSRWNRVGQRRYKIRKLREQERSLQSREQSVQKKLKRVLSK